MRSGIGGGDGDTTESESDDEVEEEESVLVNWMQQAENVPRVQEGVAARGRQLQLGPAARRRPARRPPPFLPAGGRSEG